MKDRGPRTFGAGRSFRFRQGGCRLIIVSDDPTVKSLTLRAAFFSGTLSLALLAAVSTAQTMTPRLEGGLPGPDLRLPTNWWNTDVSAAPVDPGSDAFVAYINNGGSRPLHPDFGGTLSDGIHIYGFPYIVVDGNQPPLAVQFA